MSLINKAISCIGVIPLSKKLKISYQSIQKWVNKGCLPRTEFTGETSYAKQIEKATNGQIKAKDLLKESLEIYKNKAKK